MASITEWKNRGQTAFNNERWQDAVDCYSEAIQLDCKSASLYCHRAATYIKLGQYEEAVTDASFCIQLKRDYPKGYAIKATAFHGMQEYGRAIATYKEGLKVCPDDKYMQKGLSDAKRARMNGCLGGISISSLATATTVTTMSSVHTSTSSSTHGSRQNQERSERRNAPKALSSRQKNTEKDEGQSLSSTVRDTRRRLLRKRDAIRAQLHLLDELCMMTRDEKMSRLFQALDRNCDGTVDRQELANALRKRDQAMSFSDSLVRAQHLITTFDQNGDSRLQPNEFVVLVDAMVQHMDHTNFDEFCEFLVLQFFKEELEKDGRP